MVVPSNLRINILKSTDSKSSSILHQASYINRFRTGADVPGSPTLFQRLHFLCIANTCLLMTWLKFMTQHTRGLKRKYKFPLLLVFVVVTGVLILSRLNMWLDVLSYDRNSKEDALAELSFDGAGEAYVVRPWIEDDTDIEPEVIKKKSSNNKKAPAKSQPSPTPSPSPSPVKGPYDDGPFLLQELSRRGIGNAIAEYNFGMYLAITQNISRVHVDIQCARIDLSYCADLFRLSSLTNMTEHKIQKGLSKGLLKEHKLPTDSRAKLRQFEKSIQNRLRGSVRKTDVVLKIPKGKAFHSFGTTRKFWVNAYQSARKTHPIACPLYSNEPDKVHIALHIRMGDVKKYFKNGNKRLSELRYLPPEYFVRVLQLIFQVLDQSKVKVHVFTDGSKEDIAPVLKFVPEATFNAGHSGQATIEAFHQMAAADILIGSKSGFTQAAVVVGAGDGWGVTIVPDVDWPSYHGLRNIVKIPEDVESDSLEQVEKIQAAIGEMNKRYRVGDVTGGWGCTNRDEGVVKAAIAGALI